MILTRRARFQKSPKPVNAKTAINMTSAETSTEVHFSGPELIVWICYLVLIFSLGFMQPYVTRFNNRIMITEFVFVVTVFVWLLVLAFRKLRLKWTTSFWVFGFYLIALGVSTLFSVDPYKSQVKFLSIIYLVGLAVLTANLVRSKTHLKHVFRVWIAATACAILVSLVTLWLFYIDRDSRVLGYTLSHYGTLPPGNYPRIQSTFLNPNMLCNYFTLGFAVVLAAARTGWINSSLFYCICILSGIACVLTFSPGLGGIVLCAGIWFWLSHREKSESHLGRYGLAVGVFVAVLFFLSTILTPIKSETSPFRIDLPIIEKQLDPSSRLLAWNNSLNTFFEYPLTGKGIGTNVAEVRYQNPSGRLESLTDSHQMWLNLLAQAGVPGIFAICLIGFVFVRNFLPADLSSDKCTIKSALLIGFISAFLYQGLFGSFEDARHLWVWMGFMAAVSGDRFDWDAPEDD